MSHRKHFKYYLLAALGTLLVSCSYYYYSFVYQNEIRIIEAKDSAFKVGVSKSSNPLSKNLLYVAEFSKTHNDNNFKLIDHYEKPSKIPFVNHNHLLQDQQTIQDIQISYIRHPYPLRDQVDNLAKGSYIIELGTFLSIDESTEYWKKLQKVSKGKLDHTVICCKKEIHNNKTYIKLIIPQFKNFNEAHQVCKIVREYSDTCLLKSAS